ncbi:MAG: cob(I)yrinic acid a,c-diamide adenosyltransferase, partial [Caulobacteraceae bacterium]
MVRLTRIYTRTGDAGATRLVDGRSVSKASARVAAYGETDELNAALGLARQHTGADARLDAMLARVQNDLFDLGADLATPETGTEGALRIVDAQVKRLETEIDALNADLAPLNSFVLPGGSPVSAWLHL